MPSVKNMLMAAAGAAGGGGENVESLFSTVVYDGNATANTKITTGIDLQTEGGLLWTKKRSASADHYLWDSINAFDGGTSTTYSSKRIKSNETDPLGTEANALMSFETDGFIVSTNGAINGNGSEYVSWTFRKAPNFFDIVTYTGNGANRTIAHNLGSVPGMIIVKCVSHAPSDWLVYHRSGHFSAPEDYGFLLNGTYPRQDSSGYWNDTAPTSSVFSVGTNGNVNTNGNSYVAYIFAHNNNDGEFGPDSDQDIIKCGKFEGLAATQNINIGFEPQWVLLKQSSAGTSSNWIIIDAMRGIVTGENDTELRANTTDAEVTSSNYLELTATGFTIPSNSPFNTYGPECIYMAIRRGPLAVPESASDVFNTDTQTAAGPAYTSGFVTDAILRLRTLGGSSYPMIFSRLTGPEQLITSSTATSSTTPNMTFDFMNGVGNDQLGGTSTTVPAHMWRRAPSYFDVVAYTGTQSNRTIAHNLTVPPEMIWIKSRDNTHNWITYHSALGNTGALYGPNTTEAEFSLSGTSVFNNTDPTSSVFTLGNNPALNQSGNKFIAYLFATAPGVSKVGTYNGNGTVGHTIDCGFSNGPKFVLIKRSSHGGADDGWYLFDTTRGLQSGADTRIRLDNTSAQYTGIDDIDPHSSGFKLMSLGGSDLNISGSKYIFYAVAA